MNAIKVADIHLDKLVIEFIFKALQFLAGCLNMPTCPN